MLGDFDCRGARFLAVDGDEHPVALAVTQTASLASAEPEAESHRSTADRREAGSAIRGERVVTAAEEVVPHDSNPTSSVS
jgi:hypothetical protein